MNFFRKNFPPFIGFMIVVGWQYLYPSLEFLIPALKDNPYLARSGEWLAVLLLLLVILVWERRPLSSIGLRAMTWHDLLWGLAGFFVGIVTFVITNQIVRALHLTTVGGTISQQLNQTPILVSLFTAFTAGVAEEILYRGFLIERLAAITGSLSWGAVIAFIAFVLMHLQFWGLGGLIQIGVWTLVVTGLYVWRRNLGACMLMHFLNDTFALVLAPLLLAKFLR
jgi:membrane protease YdiL (CAAX protease family)